MYWYQSGAYGSGWHMNLCNQGRNAIPVVRRWWSHAFKITLAWLWPVLHNVSLDTVTPTGTWIKHKALRSIFLCSKYPLSTFYKCAVFIIWNSTTKSLCVSLGEGEGNGKGSTGINYSQTNLLFQHWAQKTSVPAPPAIQEVLFFCSSLCFQCGCGNRSC